jgi:uncharacterized protein
MARIALTGSHGLIGSALAERLAREGHALERLARDGAAPAEGTDAVVHLAGAPISVRWTEAAKREILRSRAEPTRALAEALARMRAPPRVLVSASAVGFYGDRGDEILDESSAPGEGFLAEVCRAWEDATRPAQAAGIRVVNARTGIVVSRRGGALGKLLPPFRLGAGGRIGDGRAWWPWIDLEDEVAALLQAIRDERLAGPVNLTAPNPVRSAEFTRALARTLHRPHLVPTPAFALRAAFLGMADETLFASQRALPRKLLAAGFAFRHETLESSLRAQLAEA